MIMAAAARSATPESPAESTMMSNVHCPADMCWALPHISATLHNQDCPLWEGFIQSGGHYAAAKTASHYDVVMCFLCVVHVC